MPSLRTTRTSDSAALRAGRAPLTFDVGEYRLVGVVEEHVIRAELAVH
jgi:hypothetical protein